MPDYKLRPRAKADLVDIKIYGYDQFGEHQSETYLDGLENLFILLSKCPLMGVEERYGPPGFRKFGYGAHNVFYTVEGETVYIERVRQRSFSYQYDEGEDD